MVDRKKNVCNLLRQLQGFSLVLFISVIFQENKPETGLAFGESRGKCKLPPRQGERLLLWYGQLLKQALFSPSPRPKSNSSVQQVRNREGCRQTAASHQLPQLPENPRPNPRQHLKLQGIFSPSRLRISQAALFTGTRQTQFSESPVTHNSHSAITSN